MLSIHTNHNKKANETQPYNDENNACGNGHRMVFPLIRTTVSQYIVVRQARTIWGRSFTPRQRTHWCHGLWQSVE